MPLFSSSSRGGKVINSPTGAHSVICWSCGSPISTTVQPITRCICAICQHLVDTGKPISEEALFQYRLSRGAVEDVSLLVVEAEEKIRASTYPKFSLRSMGGDLLAALGFKKPGPAVPPVKTTGIVDAKKRKPLFSGIEEGTLGDMLDIDRRLKDK